MVCVLQINARGILVDKNDILAVVKAIDDKIHLIRLKLPANIETLYSFNGTKSLLITKSWDLYLVSIDEKLYVSHDLVEWYVALKLKRSSNSIWHACVTPEGIVVQEYGEAPTSLWISSNGRYWKRIISNIDVDPLSRHFHYVVYDFYRDVLYATLGDGNLIRAIAIKKNSQKISWKPIYKGSWQFVPIAVLNEKVIFGFDSGIAKGGVGIYYPDDNRWEFVFLRWIGKNVKFIQMTRLVPLDNDMWIAALGTPQAVTVSKNLRTWHPLCVEGFDPMYNHVMDVVYGNDKVFVVTGKNLYVYTIDEVKNSVERNPVVQTYRALIDRLKGEIFVVKKYVVNLRKRSLLNCRGKMNMV